MSNESASKTPKSFFVIDLQPEMDSGVPVPSNQIPANSDWTYTFTEHIPLTVDSQTEDKEVKITYDLSSMYHPATVLMINDTANGRDDNRFYFNVGGTLDSTLLPAACERVKFPCSTLEDTAGLDRCDDIVANHTEYANYTSTFGQDITDKGYAFKYTKSTSGDEEDDDCLLLGMDVVTPMSLYDTEDNYAHGVQVQFVNGSYKRTYTANGGSYGENCRFTLNLICPGTISSNS